MFKSFNSFKPLRIVAALDIAPCSGLEKDGLSGETAQDFFWGGI
jgi:hypothetical protein